MKRIFYDGTPASVDRIMKVTGTSGVNNVEGKRLYIRGDYLDKGGCITVDEGFWWIDHGFKVEPKKRPSEACKRCALNKPEPNHPCPYNRDVHNDPDTLCNCCEACQDECADDI